ncbi:MAG: hypothetical protein V1918_00430 [Planctomycetota bacterium]
MNACAPPPVLEEGAFGRGEWIIAFLGSNLAHLLLALLALSWGVFQVVYGVAGLRAPLEKPPVSPEPRVFLIVEDAPPEEVEEAEAVARVARLARDNAEKSLLNGPPQSEGGSPLQAPLPGEETPAPSPGALRAEELLQGPPPLARAREETPSAPEAPKATGAEKAPALKPVPLEAAAEEVPPPAEEPVADVGPSRPGEASLEEPLVFQPIGVRARQGEAAQAAEASAAELRGNLAYQALAARHPEYMAEVSRRLRRELALVASTRRRSYRVGTVQVSFGIARDGALSRLEPVSAPVEMLSELEVVLAVVRAAAPFPAFTPKMEPDAALFDDIGFIVLFQ